MGKAENAQMRQYYIVGRRLPTDKDPQPALLRLKIFAPNKVVARSRFWYFLKKTKGLKLKKASSEILTVQEVFERKPDQVKNFGVWVRYVSRTGTHNLYKEFRDAYVTGAIDQMYMDMSSRHRADFSRVQVVDVQALRPKDCVRPNIKEFHNKKMSFPLVARRPRSSHKRFKTTFKANLPTGFN